VSSLSDLIDITAIDLSHNHITTFPSLKSSPTGLLALDISFNLLQRPIVRVLVGTGSSPSLSPMSSLVELNLSNNRISE
jgi:Leucine-rich repeat (LRR) protein